jgi:hypothetical protein
LLVLAGEGRRPAAGDAPHQFFKRVEFGGIESSTASRQEA